MALSACSPTGSPISLPENKPSCLGNMDHGIQKHRKLTSTGGGRAWTEEEEAYLLRTRMHKMPYKHIASHLRKTELACRLHYHQMSYGNSRRRRAESLSSTISVDSGFHPIEESILENRSMASSSAPPSPPRLESDVGSPAPSLAHSHASLQHRSHVPILPKPTLSYSRQHTPHEPQLSKSSQGRMGSADPHNQSLGQYFIDISRLRSLYDAHRDSFWSFIASEYSGAAEVSGQKLEEAFFDTTLRSFQSKKSLPTPNGSPLIHGSSRFISPPRNGNFRAVNEPQLPGINESDSPQNSQTPVQKCAVASLLTVEKEVWAPKEIRSS